MLTSEWAESLESSVQRQEELEASVKFFARQRNLDLPQHNLVVKLATMLHVERELEQELRAAQATPTVTFVKEHPSLVTRIEEVEASIRLASGLRCAFNGVLLQTLSSDNSFVGSKEPRYSPEVREAVRYGAQIVKHVRKAAVADTLASYGMRRAMPPHPLRPEPFSATILQELTDFEQNTYESLIFVPGVPVVPPVDETLLEEQKQRMSRLEQRIALFLNETLTSGTYTAG